MTKQKTIFYDTEHNKKITLGELAKEYEELKRNHETESPSFADYIANCLTVNNGTLEIIEQ